MTVAAHANAPTTQSVFQAPRRFDGVLIFALVVLCNLWGLGESPLARTEPHRALTAHHMVESGNWILPSLCGNLYLRKPPLTYWCIAIVESIAGHGNEFIWRIPSVISSALLATFLWWIAARWWGRIAGLASGFSFLFFLALWSQNRSAEIDSINTTATMICALTMLHALYGNAKRQTLTWIIMGTSFGAMLLAKGPAGLPVLLGALLGPSLILRDWSWSRRGGFYAALLIGLALVGAWVGAVMWMVHANHLTPDMSGFKEVGDRLSPNNIVKILHAIVMPFELLIYGLPVTLCLPAVWLLLRKLPREQKINEEELAISSAPHLDRRLILAVFSAAIASHLIFGLCLIIRPRYGFPALPLWCPLVGVVAAAWSLKYFGSSVEKIMRAALTGLVILQFALAFLFTFGLPKGKFEGSWHAAGTADDHPVLIAALIVITLAAIWTLVQFVKEKQWRGCLGLVVMTMALTLTFNAFKNADRENRSGRDAAGELLTALGDTREIIAGAMVMAQPELFYYSGIRVKPIGFHFRKESQLSEGWVIMDTDEWSEWSKKIAPRFSRITPLITRGNASTPGRANTQAPPTAWLAWYTPQTTTQPNP